MNEKTYRETVTRMRAHQDAWFREHKPSDLYEAKRLEKLVDAENRRWLDSLKEVRPTGPTPTLPILDDHQSGEGARQQNLFMEDDGNE